MNDSDLGRRSIQYLVVLIFLKIDQSCPPIELTKRIAYTIDKGMLGEYHLFVHHNNNNISSQSITRKIQESKNLQI